MKFEELEICDPLKEAIRNIGFTDMTPIQEKSIPYGLQGRDITGLAQTGTGKTLSFLIPIMHKIYTDNPVGPIALILAPTRELVMQICEEAKRLFGSSGKKVATIIGGTGYKEQEKDLKENAEIVVATPGRLIDHIKSGKLDLSRIQFFVLDEADRMFDMGFIKDIRYVMKKCPEQKQVLLFSATLSYYVIRLASEYLKDPVEVRIEPEKIVTENIDQTLVHLGRDEKLIYLINSIRQEHLEEDGLGIIFTNLKALVPEIVSNLERCGIPATGISSLLDQKKRIRLLKEFKLGKFKYMVATDVASRGLDVENIRVVYNFDLPSDIENYVHRIGRTARAGKSGKSISFCSERDYTELEKIEKYIGYKIPVVHVEEEMLKMPAEFDFTPSLSLQNKNFQSRDRDRKPHFKDGKDQKFKKGPRKEKFQKDNSKDRIQARKDIKRKDDMEEAMQLLQKADSVLSKEKPKEKAKTKKEKPFQKKNRKPEKIESEMQASKESSYDKSKRNLFDINDYKNNQNEKKSIWKKIKSLFGL